MLPYVRSVVLISIDGVRPDGLLQARTPHVDRLIRTGASTMNARTVVPSVTMPCHTSMFFGVTPEVHRVMGDVWTETSRRIPSIIDVVASAGKCAASFYTWEPLRDLSRPGSLDYVHFFRNTTEVESWVDLEIARAAAAYLRRERPDFTFLHLGVTDEVGHRYGWMSPAYIDAISAADEAVGLVVGALEETGRLGETACLVLSDHGGHDYDHGTDCAEDVTIPWIIAGPGIRQNYRIQSVVHITDTAATIAELLGLSAPPEWTGRPVREIAEVVA